MAERIKFRLTAAKVGVSMAFLALIGGIAEKARSGPPQVNATQSAYFLKLGGITGEVQNAFLKLELKVLKLDSTLTKLDHKINRSFYSKHKIDLTVLKLQKAMTEYLKLDDANRQYLKIDGANSQFLKINDANSQFLKINDANSQFLKLDGTAANSNKLGGLTPDAFVQGRGGVVTGAAQVLADGSVRTLLGSPDGILSVSVTQDARGFMSLVIHNNGTVNLQAVAGDPTAVELPAGQDSALIPLGTGPTGAAYPISAKTPAATTHVQIFPAGSFSKVVTLTVSADQQQTVAGAPGQVAVVAQMLIGLL
jgi:hypothetical protein